MQSKKRLKKTKKWVFVLRAFDETKNFDAYKEIGWTTLDDDFIQMIGNKILSETTSFVNCQNIAFATTCYICRLNKWKLYERLDLGLYEALLKFNLMTIGTYTIVRVWFYVENFKIIRLSKQYLELSTEEVMKLYINETLYEKLKQRERHYEDQKKKQAIASIHEDYIDLKTSARRQSQIYEDEDKKIHDREMEKHQINDSTKTPLITK